MVPWTAPWCIVWFNSHSMDWVGYLIKWAFRKQITKKREIGRDGSSMTDSRTVILNWCISALQKPLGHLGLPVSLYIMGGWGLPRVYISQMVAGHLEHVCCCWVALHWQGEKRLGQVKPCGSNVCTLLALHHALWKGLQFSEGRMVPVTLPSPKWMLRSWHLSKWTNTCCQWSMP